METPPDRAQIFAALALGFLLLASAVGIQFLDVMPLREFSAFIPVVDAILFLSDLVTAILLIAQAGVFRSSALMALASGYLLTGLLAIAHALAFPGAFSPTGLLGAKVDSSAWLGVFWRAAFALAVCTYAVLKPKETLRFRRPAISVAVSAGSALAIATVLCLLATRRVDLLPQLMVNQHGAWQYPASIPMVVILVAICLGAITILLKGPRSRLDVWLTLSISAWAVQLPLTFSTSWRFTLAWYFAHAAGLIPHVIVMLALIAEAGRTHAKLALTVSAWNRERDARLLSMDAVIATIAHEIRQPLTAMVTDASAGLRWLDHVPPNLEMAVRSLQSNIDQGHRASDLIDSVRSVLAGQSQERTVFSLNELVRETASLLSPELERCRISVSLALAGTLAPVLADRMQIQQVIINLFTNAIHSLRATPGRPLRIDIRSASPDGTSVVLDVSDNGTGIPAGKMEHIFDVFFTTRPHGTGIGLSLCRAIVEKHGGNLWASQGEPHGATFHMQLPAAEDPRHAVLNETEKPAGLTAVS
jgi:signal transduction histidine kinase